MHSPTAYSLTKMFSQLTDLQVAFSVKPRSAPSKAKVIFGVYNELPGNQIILLKADLPLLASLGGALVGLPDSLVKDRIQGSALDETLRDAIHEVLNITSTLLSTAHRVIFRTMHTEVAHLSGDARSILDAPILACCFDVTVQGYTGGELSIFSDL